MKKILNGIPLKAEASRGCNLCNIYRRIFVTKSQKRLGGEGERNVLGSVKNYYLTETKHELL